MFYKEMFESQVSDTCINYSFIDIIDVSIFGCDKSVNVLSAMLKLLFNP